MTTAPQARSPARPRAGHVGQCAAARLPRRVCRRRRRTGSGRWPTSSSSRRRHVRRRGAATWTRDELHARRAPDGGEPHSREGLRRHQRASSTSSTARTPAKQQRARDVVGALARDRSLALSSQVLSELYVTVTRKLAEPLPPAQALQALWRTWPSSRWSPSTQPSCSAPRARSAARAALPLGRPDRRGRHRGRRRHGVLRGSAGRVRLPRRHRGRPVRGLSSPSPQRPPLLPATSPSRQP